VSSPARAGDESTGELVVLARAGDRDAWNALVRRYTRMLLRIARSFGLDEDAAQDVAQVTWLQLAQQIDAVREPAALGGWLATIARRESLNLKRRRANEQLGETDLFEREPAPDRVDVQVLTNDRDRRLWRAFELLGERCRRLLRLILAEVPYEEISEAMSMPVGSIGPTRQRCLATLRARLQEAGIHEGADSH
jgi:RNA polymerase sigma factor (sigma-70 family)